MGEVLEWNPQIEVVNGESFRSCLEIAYSCAWKYSDDPVTKTGAVIVPIGLIMLSAEQIISLKGLIPQKSRRGTENIS